jgi:hypothetical protein
VVAVGVGVGVVVVVVVVVGVAVDKGVSNQILSINWTKGAI